MTDDLVRCDSLSDETGRPCTTTCDPTGGYACGRHRCGCGVVLRLAMSEGLRAVEAAQDGRPYPDNKTLGKRLWCWITGSKE